MGIENVRSIAAHDPYGPPAGGRDEANTGNPLDSEAMRKLHGDLMSWYTAERTKQSVNRYQMALDQDFYDGLQWDPEDAAVLQERLQAPLVFNLIKPTVDWIIGTQKRARTDWKVLPRTNRPGMAETAQVKTSYLKYIRDVNFGQYSHSRAFADQVIVGLGWTECGVRGDDSDEPVYEAYESWRNVLYDSSSKAVSLDEDARYLFRWKWLDEDIGLALFPERAQLIRQAVSRSTNLVTGGFDEEGEEFWYLGQVIGSQSSMASMAFDRRTYVSDTAWINYQRRRCRLIEAWYKVPVRKQVMRGDPVLNGQGFDINDQTHRMAHESGTVSLYDCIALEMRAAVMTEKGLLWAGKSPYRHNKFPFTAHWCYRRGRDGAPYGVVRQLRDPQEDYNKRASKAQWLLSANQVVMEDGAVDDVDELREEAARPDGIIVRNRGKELEFRKDYMEVQHHITLMQQDHMHIQATSGVADELMGRQTNAVSGKAIEARQIQGSVVTADIFDNDRLSAQSHGQKLLSVCEQFTPEPRVIRVAGAKGKIEWISINEPVLQPDGSVVFLNDITAEQADYSISEQDYYATVRQAMFETMMEMLGRLPPEVAMKILPHILELSDIPDKDEFIAEIREALGIQKPPADASEEERAEFEQRQRQAKAVQQQMDELQMRKIKAETEEAEAKVRKTSAEADRAEAEAQEKREGGADMLKLLAEQVAALRQTIKHLAHPANAAAPATETETA
jgi:hypothetical protein